MSNREFVIWLIGYLELCPHDLLTRKKLFIIKNHMNLIKAVDGMLGEINSIIWEKVVFHLEKHSDEKILQQWKAELYHLLGIRA